MSAPLSDPDDDLAACRAALRAGSRSFGLAARLLPRDTRHAATALYAFCRAADDAVDGAPPSSTPGQFLPPVMLRPGGQAQPVRLDPLARCTDAAHPGLLVDKRAALHTLHRRLDALYEGRAEGPAERAMAACGPLLPRPLLDALLEGFAWDAEGRRCETLSDLVDYAMRVAGSVGVMMGLLMGARDAAVLAAAAELGCAMQMTNIARDVGEDARAGRLYLPLGWLREAGLDPERFLAAPAPSPALAGVVSRLLAEADRRYRRAQPAIARLPRRCRPAIRAAAGCYAAIGPALVQAGLDPVGMRAVVPFRRKLPILLAAFLPRWPASLAAPDPGVRFLLDTLSIPNIETRSWLGRLDDRVAWTADLFARLAEAERAANL